MDKYHLEEGIINITTMSIAWQKVTLKQCKYLIIERNLKELLIRKHAYKEWLITSWFQKQLVPQI